MRTVCQGASKSLMSPGLRRSRQEIFRSEGNVGLEGPSGGRSDRPGSVCESDT